MGTVDGNCWGCGTELCAEVLVEWATHGNGGYEALTTAGFADGDDGIGHPAMELGVNALGALGDGI